MRKEGNLRLQLRQRRQDPSAVSMMFAPGCRKMTQQQRLLAIDKSTLRISSTESETVAMSESLTARRSYT